MCGRYTLTSPDELLQEFGIAELPFDLAPRYNIAPSQEVPVVLARPARTVERFRWGLIPSWADDPKIAHRLINARSESVGDKPAFRSAFAQRRCLVAADGFFEWKKQGRQRIPFYVHRRSSRIMAYAGIWERWKSADGQPVHTFAILTTSANRVVEPIHDRMPVIIEPRDYDRWLAPGPLPDAARAELLVPAADDALEVFEVSTRVNSPAFDDPECIRKGPSQPSLF